MFAVPLLLLLLVARPTICTTSVDARAAVREYSEQKDPYGRLRLAIATDNVVGLDETECDVSYTPLVVYVDDKGREPSLLDPALFSGLVEGGRLLYLETRWCFESSQRGSSAENGSLGCYSDPKNNTVLIPLGGKVRGSVFARSCEVEDDELISRMSQVFDTTDAIAKCPWRKYPVGSVAMVKCDGSTKSATVTCNDDMQWWETDGCDEERLRADTQPSYWQYESVKETSIDWLKRVHIGKVVSATIGGVGLAYATYRGCRSKCRDKSFCGGLHTHACALNCPR
ncbi:uncharacterized protein LOC125757679 [Rhipicephalus sanguineus]|uniref:uncharacterized protein LOC125757679 n=1 Tax=Rhipicephalus sanguineus TaxID=34632 RepID=UPI0020C3904E|nr:uncharacterized protein LOC125757679 [Rhipicephalus sanguineus]